MVQTFFSDKEMLKKRRLESTLVFIKTIILWHYKSSLYMNSICVFMFHLTTPPGGQKMDRYLRKRISDTELWKRYGTERCWYKWGSVPVVPLWVHDWTEVNVYQHRRCSDFNPKTSRIPIGHDVWWRHITVSTVVSGKQNRLQRHFRMLARLIFF